LLAGPLSTRRGRDRRPIVGASASPQMCRQAARLERIVAAAVGPIRAAPSRFAKDRKALGGHRRRRDEGDQGRREGGEVNRLPDKERSWGLGKCVTAL